MTQVNPNLILDGEGNFFVVTPFGSKLYGVRSTGMGTSETILSFFDARSTYCEWRCRQFWLRELLRERILSSQERHDRFDLDEVNKAKDTKPATMSVIVNHVDFPGNLVLLYIKVPEVPTPVEIWLHRDYFIGDPQKEAKKQKTSGK